MKDKKFTLAAVITAVTSMLLWGAGYALGTSAQSNRDVNAVIYLVLLGVILITAGSDFIMARLLVKKLNSFGVKDVNDYMLARVDEAENNLYAVADRTARIARSAVIYIITLTVIACAYIFMAGAARLSCALGVIIILYIVNKLLIISEKPDFSEYSSPSDYPRIYELARKAQKELGQEGEIHIVFPPNYQMGIARMGKEYSLIIGTILLSIATEEELYQGLLHEFAHFTKNCSPSHKEDRLLCFFTHNDFKYPCLQYVKAKFVHEYYVYKATSSMCIERLADKQIATKGNPKAAGTFLIKLDHFDHFNRSIASYMGKSFYESETLGDDVTERIVERFKEVLPEKRDMWLKLIENEIQPRNASHPIVRSRLEGLGVSLSDCTVILPDRSDDEFYGECRKALRMSDKNRYESSIEIYEQERKLYYLDNVETIKKWKDEGCDLSGARARDILDTMVALTMNDEAIRLCDRIIEECESEYEKAHAYYIKGRLLIDNYDPSGIEYLYQAIELNDNYIDDGMEQIGWICCTLGLREELERYREKAPIYRQKKVDNYYSAETIIKGKNIVPHDLPAEVFDENLEFMISKGDGQIFRLFLVGIQMPKGCINAYIVDFELSCDPQMADGIMYDIFCYLDTRPDGRHYALFRFEEKMGKTLVKHKASLIFEK